MKIDLSQVDMKNEEEVREASAKVIKEIWSEYIQGAPLAIVINVTAYLNAHALQQFLNPHQLLYAIEKNHAIFENVILELEKKIGPAAMASAFRTEDGEEQEKPEVMH